MTPLSAPKEAATANPKRVCVKEQMRPWLRRKSYSVAQAPSGAAIVHRLAEEGKAVRSVVRNAERARALLPPSAEVARGDATSMQDVRSLCRDADVVYHCVNLPYAQWAEVMPQVTQNILTGTHEAGAVLVFPGNVYGYGPFQTIPAAEDHPLAATTKKGQLRNRLERTLMEAHQAGQARVVIPRFPDYYGPNVTNRLVVGIFEGALAGRMARWPGRLDVPYDFVYVRDAAAACMLLGATESAAGQV